MKGFLVWDSASGLWFHWDGEKYAHRWDAKNKAWVDYSSEENPSQPPESKNWKLKEET